MKNIIFCMTLLASAQAFATTPQAQQTVSRDTIPSGVLAAGIAVLAIPGAGEAEVVVVVAAITALILTYGIVETVKELCAQFADVRFVETDNLPGSKCKGNKMFVLTGAPDILITVLNLLPGVCIEKSNHYSGNVYYVAFSI